MGLCNPLLKYLWQKTFYLIFYFENVSNYYRFSLWAVCIVAAVDVVYIFLKGSCKHPGVLPWKASLIEDTILSSVFLHKHSFIYILGTKLGFCVRCCLISGSWMKFYTENPSILLSAFLIQMFASLNSHSEDRRNYVLFI